MTDAEHTRRLWIIITGERLELNPLCGDPVLGRWRRDEDFERLSYRIAGGKPATRVDEANVALVVWIRGFDLPTARIAVARAAELEEIGGEERCHGEEEVGITFLCFALKKARRAGGWSSRKLRRNARDERAALRKAGWLQAARMRLGRDGRRRKIARRRSSLRSVIVVGVGGGGGEVGGWEAMADGSGEFGRRPPRVWGMASAVGRRGVGAGRKPIIVTLKPRKQIH